MSSGRGRWFARLAALLPAVLAVLVTLGHTSTANGVGEAGCGATQRPSVGLPGERKARLKPNPDDETMLLFRRSRRPRALDLRPGILDEGPAARTAVEIDVRPFRRSDGETIPPGQIVVTQSIVSNNQQNLRIEVCVDPASPEPVPPGTYSGTLIVDDPAFDSAPLELTVVLQDTRLYAPFMLALLAALTGVLVQWFVRSVLGRSGAGGGSTGNVPFGPWRLSQRILELVAGLLAGVVAAIPVYNAHYDRNPAWILDLSHSWGLAVASFTAASTLYPGSAALIRRLVANGGGEANHG